MHIRLTSSLTLKAGLTGLLVLSCIIVPLFFITSRALQHFGLYSSSTNREQIITLSENYLHDLTLERARSHDHFFSKIQSASALMATHAATIYDRMSFFASSPLVDKPIIFQASNRIFYTHSNEPVITAYFGGTSMSPELMAEQRALTHLDPLLISAKKAVPECLASHIITLSGFGCYHTLNREAYNAIYTLPPPGDFDIRNGEPVTTFYDNPPVKGETRWTSIYRDDVINGFMMTAVTPIIDGQGRFRGITGIDLPLTTITGSLVMELSASAENRNGILFSFLLDKDGNLIAFPEIYQKLFGLSPNVSGFTNSSHTLDYPLRQSSLPEIKSAAEKLLRARQGMIKTTLKGETFRMTYGTLETTGWLIVLVTREKDLVASVELSQDELERSIKSVWTSFIRYSAIILLAVLLALFWIVRQLLDPIKRLTAATEAVTAGDFSALEGPEHQNDMKRKDEIGTLSRSFDTMRNQLQHAATLEKNSQEMLEIQISQRTEELRQTNKELMDIRQGLETLVALRTQELKELNEYLILTEERERKSIAGDLHDTITQNMGICVSKLKTFGHLRKPVLPEQLMDIQELLEDSIREARLLIYQLRPPIIEDFDLEIALGWLIEETNSKRDMNIHYINSLTHPTVFEEATKVALYRIMSELLANIIKHAQTREAEVEISEHQNMLTIRVQDYGRGFDPKDINRSITGGFGLFNVLERLKHLGGYADLASAPENGTTVVLTIPLENESYPPQS